MRKSTKLQQFLESYSAGNKAEVEVPIDQIVNGVCYKSQNTDNSGVFISIRNHNSKNDRIVIRLSELLNYANLQRKSKQRKYKWQRMALRFGYTIPSPKVFPIRAWYRCKCGHFEYAEYNTVSELLMALQDNSDLFKVYLDSFDTLKSRVRKFWEKRVCGSCSAVVPDA